jgi:hypothetical protein
MPLPAVLAFAGVALQGYACVGVAWVWDIDEYELVCGAVVAFVDLCEDIVDVLGVSRCQWMNSGL